MCINMQSFIAFILMNIYIYIFFFINFLIIFLFVLVFPNISLNNHIRIHICPFLVDPNIFIYKIGSKYIRIFIRLQLSTPIYLYSYLPKNINLNIFIFVFRPENCICHTLPPTLPMLTPPTYTVGWIAMTQKTEKFQNAKKSSKK